MGINKAADFIGKHNGFLLTTHINAEGDAIGSELATALLLSRLGKDFIMVNSDPVPDYLKFLPFSENIIIDAPDSVEFKAAIILDCPFASRSGRVSRLFKGKPVVNIDHHISNEKFGDINWVEAKASSCGEMLIKLFKKFKITVDKNTALCLYVSILTDTGCFSYDNTSSKTHRITAELLKRGGIDPAWVSNKIYQKNSVDSIRLLALALATLKLESNGRIAHIMVTDDMMKRTNTSPVETESFVEIARTIKDVEVVLFFREIQGKDAVHVSFRSKGDIDVNKIAAAFGGGGHHKAAGCTVDGNMEEVRKKVADEVKKIVR